MDAALGIGPGVCLGPHQAGAIGLGDHIEVAAIEIGLLPRSAQPLPLAGIEAATDQLIGLGEGFLIGRPGVVDGEAAGGVAVQPQIPRLHHGARQHREFPGHGRQVALAGCDAEEAVVEVGELVGAHIGYAEVAAVDAPFLEVTHQTDRSVGAADGAARVGARAAA